MKWLKRKIRDWVRDANEDDSMTIGSNMVVASRDVEASMCDAEPILNFRVFCAVFLARLEQRCGHAKVNVKQRIYCHQIAVVMLWWW